MRHCPKLFKMAVRGVKLGLVLLVLLIRFVRQVLLYKLLRVISDHPGGFFFFFFCGCFRDRKYPKTIKIEV